MPYQWDVFISYPVSSSVPDYLRPEPGTRESDEARWVRKVFAESLYLSLRAELGRKPDIFLDTKLKSGDAWEAMIKRHLVTSRMLIPIWSPEYFYHEWCMKEWSVMVDRELKTHLGSLNKPGLLVAPVIVHKGVGWPPMTKRYQQKDCCDCYSFPEVIVHTLTHQKLRDKMDRFAKDISEKIGRAPQWQDEWLDEIKIEKAMVLWKSLPEMQPKPPTQNYVLETMG